MVIATGKRLNPLAALGARRARHLVRAERQSGDGPQELDRRPARPPAPRCTVDAGAVAALLSGKSLLPAGVKRVEGRFSRGDVVHRARPGWRRDRARPRRLRLRGRRPHRRLQVRPHRGNAGLCRAQRDDPPRRPGGERRRQAARLRRSKAMVEAARIYRSQDLRRTDGRASAGARGPPPGSWRLPPPHRRMPRCSPWPTRLSERTGDILDANALDMAAAEEGGACRRHARPPDAQSRAHRSHGRRASAPSPTCPIRSAR